MIALRFHRPIAFTAAFTLFMSVFAPMAAVCQEMEAAQAAHCVEMEGAMGMGTMAHHAPAAATPLEAAEIPAERPEMGEAMPCCMVVATTTPRADAERLLALTAAVTVFRVERPALAPQLVPRTRGTAPPGEPVPLYIALGRFLT